MFLTISSSWLVINKSQPLYNFTFLQFGRCKSSQSGMIISCAGYLLSQELIAQLQFGYTQHVSSECFASAFQLIYMYIVARFLKFFLINTKTTTLPI